MGLRAGPDPAKGACHSNVSMRLTLRPAGIEIHEWVYLTLFAVYAGLLSVHGLAWTAAFAEMAGVTVGTLLTIAWSQSRPGLVARRVRWFYFMAAMGVCYHALGAGVPAFRPDGAPLLQEADRLLTGGFGGVWMERFRHPVLTELMSWGYMGLFPYLILGLWRHGWVPGEHAGPFFRALGLVYALGFAGYILCPAAGPYLDAGSGFIPPPAGWLGTRLAEAMVIWGSNRVDCFPSLHCAVSGLVLVFDARADRRLFFWHSPVVAGIWLSTVWLGQHYFVDVLGGLVLLAGVLWLVRRPALAK